jgi:hypothetical protein
MSDNYWKQKEHSDANFIIRQIYLHSNKDSIISMFFKGPPENEGFMWCGCEGGPARYWTCEEANGLKYVSNLVLDKGWDSSGFGFMMRVVQDRIKKEYLAIFILKQKFTPYLKHYLALSILKRKFTPYLLHYLYKPDGIRMKHISKITLVGKNSDKKEILNPEEEEEVVRYEELSFAKICEIDNGVSDIIQSNLIKNFDPETIKNLLEIIKKN